MRQQSAKKKDQMEDEQAHKEKSEGISLDDSPNSPPGLDSETDVSSSSRKGEDDDVVQADLIRKNQREAQNKVA